MRCLWLALEALPPDVAVVGQRHVRVERVAGLDGLHRVRVGAVVGAGSDTEETELGVHRVQPTVFTETHPGDVVAQGLGTPARDRRLDHREVGLATGARERGRDVVGLVLRADQLEDQHVLGEPALVVCHRRGDPQRVALLAQQRVAAVARSVGPDLAVLGEVGDVLLRVARPRHVLLAGFERRAQRVQRLDEEPVLTEGGDHLGSDAGHDPHREHHVGGVGDLDAELRVVRAERAHAERDDVHRATAHAAAVEVGHRGAHLGRIDPVVRRAGVDLVLRADVGP